MSDNQESKNIKSDEIDLFDLFRRMGNTLSLWFRALGRATLISIVFLIRRWLPLGISLVLAIGGSYFLKYTSDSAYTSDLVLRNNLGTNSDLIDYINKLHKFCAEMNKSALSDAMGLTTDKVSNILDISAYWFIDKKKDGIPDYVDYTNTHNVYDTTNIRMQDRFDIRVSIKEPQDLGMIRNSVISFINNDSVFLQRNRLRNRQYQELLVRLNIDIKQLDSLQKVKYFEETKNFSQRVGGQIVFLQEQKTQLLYQDIYNLFSRKQYVDSELTLHSGIVTVLSDFSVPFKRVNGGLFYAKKLVPIFFGLTLLLLILIANHKKILDIFNKY